MFSCGPCGASSRKVREPGQESRPSAPCACLRPGVVDDDDAGVGSDIEREANDPPVDPTKKEAAVADEKAPSADSADSGATTRTMEATESDPIRRVPSTSSQDSVDARETVTSGRTSCGSESGSDRENWDDPRNPISRDRAERSWRALAERKASRRRKSSPSGRTSAAGRRRKSGNRTTPKASPSADEEEGRFLEVLDLLEEHDEFDASSGSDGSVIDDDDFDDESYQGSSDGEGSDASLEDRLHCPERQRQFEEWGTLEDWELAAALQGLRQRRLPNMHTVARILRDLALLYAEMPTVVHIKRPHYDMKLVIVGDLHGHFGDLMHILDEHGDPSTGPGGTMYLFNGDFVDRGEWGPEVLLLLYCMKLQFPNAVFLNRGNHEDDHQNRLADNGFSQRHCNRAFMRDGQAMYALCRASFKQLPLIHVVAGEIAVMHGGLPLDTGITLEEINSIDRKHRVPITNCNLLGYVKGQKVKAKVDIDGEGSSGQSCFIRTGTVGKLRERIRRTNIAAVRFPCGIEAEVEIAGAPELEEQVEICYDSKSAQKKQRLQRIFVALLWSDPVQQGCSGPSRRGVGSHFDAYVTREFLETNGLKFIIRSHEKRQQGFCQEHLDRDRGVLTATVFSASNYPSGAGEPGGNKASVIALALTGDKRPLALPATVPAWREPYSKKSRWIGGTLSANVKARLSVAEADKEEPESSRIRAVTKLRTMIYCARPQLLSFWNRVDESCTGYITAAEWASAMRACVVPDEDFPWEWLMKHLTHVDDFGNCQYAIFLNRYENGLLRRLAQRWHGGAISQLAPGVVTREDAETAWRQADRDGNGKLTYQELRPVLRTKAKMAQASAVDRLGSYGSLKIDPWDPAADDDRVYSILQCLDHDRSGFVDKEEFINAVMNANERKSLVEEATVLTKMLSMDMGDGGGTGSSPAHRMPSKSAFSSSLSCGRLVKRTSLLLDNELKTAGDAVISQCWIATQTALRALAAAKCSVESVFSVLDTDSDGKIDRAEFREGLMQLIHDASVLHSIDQWEPLLWRVVDEDSSGSVSHAELASLLSIRDIETL